MSKVKQWAEDTAETNVDTIIQNYLTQGLNVAVATKQILAVENVKMLGINSENVDEVLNDATVNKVLN